MTDEKNDDGIREDGRWAAAGFALKDAVAPAMAKARPSRCAAPWPDNALAALHLEDTIGFHHGKDHKAYVENLNGLIAGKPEAD